MGRPIVAITMGDAAGIGPEIIVKALADAELRSKARMLVIGDLRRLQLAADIVSSPLTLRKVSEPSEALFDEGTLELITEDDGSGMLAAVGRVNGTHVVAFCSDATVMGGAMGEVGCKVVVRAYERALADQAPVVGLWNSGFTEIFLS